jgi:class I fructose-bisphosphate aldolase
MYTAALEKLSRDGKIMMIAYDQGFEHGPTDLNDQNYDPNYIFNIALRGGYTCVATQYSIARKFWLGEYRNVPLVVKMNGRTKMGGKAYSVANSTVKEAVELGASAVGYTLYIGGEYEAEMIHEFSHLRRDAHDHGLAVFAWMYPWMTMPSSNDEERNAEIVAYASRVGAELGADVVKIKLPHQMEALPWIIKNAVGTKAIMSGGDPRSDEEFLSDTDAFMRAGGSGVAVGRNAWQHHEPLEFSRKLHAAIFSA